MTTALSTLSALPLTKGEIDRFSKMAISEILSGEANPLKVYLQFKAIANTIDLINKDKKVKNAIIEEASKYEGKTFEAMGANITISTKTNYDYSVCNFEKYNKLVKEKEELEEQIAELQNFLKTVKEPIASVETGELINPPIKTGSEYLTVRFL